MTKHRYKRLIKRCTDCDRKHYTLKELDRGTDLCRRCRGWHICRDCHKKLSNDEYHQRGDGLRSTCKECHIAKVNARLKALKAEHKVPTVEQHSDQSEELRHFLRTVKPTKAEVRLIHKAIARYGKRNPSFGEVLGMKRMGTGHNEWWVEIEPVRPGIWSIANLMALEAVAQQEAA